MVDTDTPREFIPVPDQTPDALSCRSCGYALRGLQTHSRCPECGYDIILSFYAMYVPAMQRRDGWLRSTGTTGLLIMSILWLLTAGPYCVVSFIEQTRRNSPTYSPNYGMDGIGAAFLLLICMAFMAYLTVFIAGVLILITPRDDVPGGVLRRVLASAMILGWLIAVPASVAGESESSLVMLYAMIPAVWLLIMWQWSSLVRQSPYKRKCAIWLLTAAPAAVALVVLLFGMDGTTYGFFEWVMLVTGMHSIVALACAIVLKGVLQIPLRVESSTPANRAER